MTDIVVCEPLRTAVGRYGGALKDVSAAELGSTVLRAVVERSGVDPEAIADVVVGHAVPSADAPAIGRVIALDAGLP
ncbi:MAG: acetyl-CoA C-acyltransferase, partial [Dermatophilaceae bacterium]